MNIGLIIGILVGVAQLLAAQSYQNHVVKCVDGQYWNGQQCEQCADKYGICSSDPQNTTSCQSGYYLKPHNGFNICEVCPDNCKQCFESKVGMSLICSSCVDNSVLISGTCQVIENCQIINLTLGSCLKCNDGYYLNESNQCTICDPSCLTCLEASVCSTCIDGYSFLDKTFLCTKCDNKTTVKNCISCVQSDITYECQGCMPQYYYSTSTQSCESCPDNCETCVLQQNQLKCLSCKSDPDILQNVSGKCLSCQIEIQNCQSCALFQDAIKCISCRRGYYYNSVDNTCQQCTKNTICNSSDSQPSTQIIIQCPDAMNLLQNDCLSNIQNCAIMQDKTTCKTCVQNYYLDNNTCKQVADTANCLRYQTNTNICKLCNQQYYLYNGICNKNDVYCITQNQPTKCVQYIAKYYEEGGIPTQCTDPTQTPGATYKSCGFLEISGNTITCNKSGISPGNCEEYDSSQVGCLVWEKNTRNCVQCLNNENFYLNSKLKKCGKVQGQCLEVIEGTTKCSLCKAEKTNYYAVKNGVCVNCANKESGYYICQSLLDQSIKAQSLTADSPQLSSMLSFNLLLLMLLLSTL